MAVDLCHFVFFFFFFFLSFRGFTISVSQYYTISLLVSYCHLKCFLLETDESIAADRPYVCGYF